MDVASGISHGQIASIRMFLLHAVGIMSEDAVQEVTSSLRIHRLLRMVAGYAWVVFLLWWSTPIFLYPSIRAANGEGILPFSLAKALISQPS